MTMVINSKGELLELEYVMEFMDREYLKVVEGSEFGSPLPFDSPQQFFRVYCMIHLANKGERFEFA